MKIVMTLMARDEADIVDDHVRYHLDAGVDFVVATDHRSVDGTTEILRSYEREGRLHLIRKTDEAYRQADWVTQMARLAASEFGADWVINSDVDEFWWPHDGTLREVLTAVPSSYGAVRGIWRHFVLRPEMGESFYERMIVRRMPSLDVADPYCATAKVIHRGDPDVIVASGNHDALGQRLKILREWIPFEMLHFPIRSRDQLERKYRTARKSHALADAKLVSPHVLEIAAILAADADEVYSGFLVDDDALERGLANGSLIEDLRLRDALGGRALPTRPSLVDDAAFAHEIDAALSLDSAHRLAARVESFERRIASVEARRRALARRRRQPI